MSAVVCIPARNEAERLPRLLRSLAAQEGISEAAPLRVVMLANNCDDGTPAIVRGLAGALPTLALRTIEAAIPAPDAHVGTARRMALEAGADWLAADGHADGILLTTDADAWVPPNWLAANRAALRAADVVGGRLVIDAEDAVPPALADLHARIERYWSGVRALEDLIDPPPHDPAPRHGDHTAASLALWADLYRAVGGLPALPCGEDNALVARLTRQGARLRHCPAVAVHVSARREGRVSGGMATEMARRADAVASGGSYELPEAAHWLALIERRAALRQVWRRGEAARRAACLGFGLPAEAVAEIEAAVAGGTCLNDIAYVERVHALLEAAAEPARFVPLDAAVADLERIARTLRAAA
nr:glycosyltransferase [Methylobacterium radiodurans]